MTAAVRLPRSVLLLGALALAPGRPPGAEPTPAALVAAHRACDRLRLASLVRALPEARLAALLAQGSRPERLAVLRGASGAADPVALLRPLADTMASGDPELAPAAALALLAIVPERALAATGDHSAAEVRAALGPALALAGNALARPDLRAAARALDAFASTP